MTLMDDEDLVWLTTLELLACEDQGGGGSPPGAGEEDGTSGRPMHDELTDEPLGGI